MRVWRGLTQVPDGFGPSMVTIGNFDGVHLGHQTVLRQLAADAKAADLASVAITFTPHPLHVHRPHDAPPLVTGDTDRLELLAATGLDAVLLVDYTLEFAGQTPEEFVRTYLVDALHATTVVVGRDTRFGRGNSGDLATLVALGERFGFGVRVVEDIADVADDAGRRWSSTWLRELLATGDVVTAARVLGRPHRIRGVVVHGDARGRLLGYPTANLEPETAGMVPADGVYAGWLRRTRAADGTELFDQPEMPAAVSIGTNPTFDGLARRVEAYVLDRDDLELYDEEVVVEVMVRLRPMARFESVDELLAQMAVDVAQAREVLGRADRR
ncbi:MAG: bifunctional riboflavin kinase/FAD synthetase [Cellulomonas sp.]|nr:bifunctional riboflavin kinase/FAD synthetase [Cellulomonas sp.]